MSRRSKPFVSLGAAVLLSACHGMPAHPDAPIESPPGDAVAPSGGAAGGGAAGGGAAVPEHAAQQYEAALTLAKAGHNAEAESEFKQLSTGYPALSGPDLNLGLLYLHDARLPEAEGAFKTALERNPANAAAGNELGIVERRLGKFTEAEVAYQRTIAADPNYAPAYLNLGVLYDLYLAEPQKALEQFDHYLQLAGDNKQVSGWVVELRKRVGVAAAKKEPPA